VAGLATLGITVGSCQLLSGLSAYHDTGAGGTSATTTSGTGGLGGASTSSASSSSTSSTSSTSGGCDAGGGAVPGSVVWARSLSAMAPTSVAQSSTGVVVVGYFAAPVSLGGSLLAPSGPDDTAFAQFAVSDATYQYQNSFGGGPGQVYGFLDQLAPSESPLLYGVAFGPAYDLGLGQVEGGGPDGGGPDGFVGQYAAAGAPGWVQRLVGSGEGQFIAAVNGPTSTVFAAGWFSQATVLEQTPDAPLPLISAGDRDILLAQFDLYGGGPVMHQTYGSPGLTQQAYGMVWTGSQLVMTGDFDPATTFGTTTPLISAGGDDAFVVALQPDGTPVWSVRFGGVGFDSGTLVTVDAGGDLYVCGRFSDQVTFGTSTLMSAGGTDVFVTKLRGSDGSVVWATSFGSTNDDRCQGLAIDSCGRIFVSADIQGPIDPGGPYYGGYDAALLAFENTGARRWTQVLGTSGDDYANGVTAPSESVFTGVSLGGDIGTSIAGVTILDPPTSPSPGGLLLKMQP